MFSNLTRNDAPTSSTDETPSSLTRLLKQMVELYIDARKETNEANTILREVNTIVHEVKTISQKSREELRRREEDSRRREEDSRRREEKTTRVLEEVIQWIKRQEHAKKRTLEPQLRDRQYLPEPDMRSRGVPYVSQNPGQYNLATEQHWYVQFPYISLRITEF